MSVPTPLQRIVSEFRARQGLSASTQHLAATIHLMNEHRLDKDSALDQSSRAANDRGMDAWAFSPNWDSLTIYQSKFTENLGLSLKGLKDLRNALEWLEIAICDEKRPEGNLEHSLVNLLDVLSRHRDKVKTVSLVLLSLSQEDAIRETREFEALIKDLEKSRLHRLLVQRGGGLDLLTSRHNFKKGVARIQKSYPVKTFSETQIEMRDGVRLSIAYLSLIGLVRLYRERGIVLFDKNVRFDPPPKVGRSERVRFYGIKPARSQEDWTNGKEGIHQGI